MKPVIQTVTEAGRGNCLAACVASILEIPIEAVPDLKCGADFAALSAFLAARGMVPIWLHVAGLAASYVGHSPAHCIVIGDSPRRPVQHAVVGKPKGYGFEIVHDPHPEGGGIKGEPKSVIYFGALTPTAAAGH